MVCSAKSTGNLLGLPNQQLLVSIRQEVAEDIEAVFRVQAAAFSTEAEAQLVDRLRANGHASVSLVAVMNDAVVGHVLFSPVRVVDEQGMVVGAGLGLAPVGVLPAFQNRGIGKRLIVDGLAACSAGGTKFVVVLGDPTYYQRFGFQLARPLGIRNEYEADEHFMVLSLSDEPLPVGSAKFGPEFAELG